MITLLLKKLDGTIETKVVEPNYKVSPNFSTREFLINRNDDIQLACVSQYDLDTLQTLRILYNLPIQITSAGRTPEYNKKIGGALNSNHQYLFDCLDWVISADINLDHVYKYLLFRGYTGIGRYAGGRFHTDRGYRDKLTVWDMR